MTDVRFKVAVGFLSLCLPRLLLFFTDLPSLLHLR